MPTKRLRIPQVWQEKMSVQTQGQTTHGNGDEPGSWTDNIEAADRQSVSQAALASVLVRLLDENAEPAGGDFVLEIPSAIWVETPGEHLGQLGFSEVQPGLELEIERDDYPDAQILEVVWGDLRQNFTWDQVAQQEIGDPEDRCVFNSDAKFRIVIVAEKFNNFSEFAEACHEFFNFLVEQAPFSEFRERFGLNGLYWTGSNFDVVTADNRLLEGDHTRILSAASNEVNNPGLVLALVNAPEYRGGAGGDSTRPAYASIGGNDWKEVALHELGHSLGLGDEYVDDRVPDLPPSKLEPNLTTVRNANSTACPWHSMVKPQGPHDPTLRHDQDEGTITAETIGTFQGARYRAAKYFRPTINCRMRNTLDQFCPVCCHAIRDKLLA